MAFETDTEAGIVFRIDNINKALAALNQTIMQLKGVAYIGDDRRTQILAKTAIDLTEAISRELNEMRSIDAVDEAISKQVNEQLLSLLREASFNLK